jgi:hypothetical protein
MGAARLRPPGIRSGIGQGRPRRRSSVGSGIEDVKQPIELYEHVGKPTGLSELDLEVAARESQSAVAQPSGQVVDTP